MRCLCGISRFFFCQFTDEKKSTFELSVHHDDDYQFALTLQESFKTLPPLFNVEEFERSQLIVGGQINQSEFSTVSEQLLQAPFANPAPQASDLKPDTLATAVVC